MIRIVLLSILAILLGCHSKPTPPASLAHAVALEAGIRDWADKQALGADIHVDWAARPAFDARLTAEIPGQRVRMQLADNAILVFDGQSSWLSPASAANDDIDFALRFWPYLVELSLRIKDAGGEIGPTESLKMSQMDYVSARIVLPPQSRRYMQWVRLFADPKTNRLLAIAFQPTAGASLDEPVPGPRAITFYDFKQIEGVWYPTQWRIWKYNPTEGLFGRPVGSVRVYNLEFVTPRKGAFDRPPG
jgi:hypothetical protein